MIELVHATTEHIAAATTAVADPAGDGLGTGGFRKWLNDNGVATLLAVIALVIGLGAMKRDAGKVITIGALACVMLLFVGIAQSSAAQQSVSTTMLGWIGLG